PAIHVEASEPCTKPTSRQRPACKIRPCRVALLDQVDLPLARPFLQGLLAPDCFQRGAELLKVDKPHDAVARRKRTCLAGAVLRQSACDVARHADVQRSSLLACENVDIEHTAHAGS